MKKHRVYFKLSLRKCKKRIEEYSMDNLASHFLTKDSKSFWKQVNKKCGSTLQGVSTTVGGADGPVMALMLFAQCGRTTILIS